VVETVLPTMPKAFPNRKEKPPQINQRASRVARAHMTTPWRAPSPRVRTPARRPVVSPPMKRETIPAMPVQIAAPIPRFASGSPGSHPRKPRPTPSSEKTTWSTVAMTTPAKIAPQLRRKPVLSQTRSCVAPWATSMSAMDLPSEWMWTYYHATDARTSPAKHLNSRSRCDC
jgi:hypothetical protein